MIRTARFLISGTCLWLALWIMPRSNVKDKLVHAIDGFIAEGRGHGRVKDSLR